MREEEGWWSRRRGREGGPLAWPDYPAISTTLLAAVGVAGLFLGLGTLTMEGWVTWLGLVVAAGVLASHLLRYRRVYARRSALREALDARLIGQCRGLGESTFLRAYSEGEEPLLLVLTDDALHVGRPDPLEIFATLPLYDISHVQAGTVSHPRWDTDEVGDAAAGAAPVLNLAVRMSGQRVHRLAFGGFERRVPPSLWETTLQGMLPASGVAASE